MKASPRFPEPWESELVVVHQESSDQKRWRAVRVGGATLRFVRAKFYWVTPDRPNCPLEMWRD